MQIVQAAQISALQITPASVVAQWPVLEVRQNVWLMMNAKVIQHIKEFSLFKQSTLKSPF